jgi:hypothetical protein
MNPKMSAAARVLLSAVVVAQVAAQGPPKLYKQPRGSLYHLAECSYIKGDTNLLEATIEEAATGRLDACNICKPDENPQVKAAIAAFRVARDAANAAAAKKATDDRNAAAAKKAADAAAALKAREAKAAADAADLKRREAAPLTRVAETQLRPMVTSSVSAAHNDVAIFDKAFNAAIHAVAPDYHGAVSLVSTEQLSAIALGPVARMHLEAREAVRKFEVFSPAPWANAMDIEISPLQIDSPDIEKIILQRNGVAVAQLQSTLAPRELTTRMGAKATLHAGRVRYPVTAFDPGAGVTVTIIFIPASGTNIVKTFGSIALRAFQ